MFPNLQFAPFLADGFKAGVNRRMPGLGRSLRAIKLVRNGLGLSPIHTQPKAAGRAECRRLIFHLT